MKEKEDRERRNKSGTTERMTERMKMEDVRNYYYVYQKNIIL